MCWWIRIRQLKHILVLCTPLVHVQCTHMLTTAVSYPEPVEVSEVLGVGLLDLLPLC